MPKYVVDVTQYVREDTWSHEVYRGDNPKEALFAWSIASYCAPGRVSINTGKTEYAKELIEMAYKNSAWLKGHCTLHGFPYKWEYLEGAILEKHLDGYKDFHETKYPEYERGMVYPFDVA